MLINAAGQMVTQRQLPALALLQPQIQGEILYLTASGRAPIALNQGEMSW